MGFVDALKDPSATVIGGMSFLYRLKVGVQHFGELSGRIVLMALHDGYNSQRIDVVFDNYKEITFKAAETVRHGDDDYQLSGERSGGQKIHQWDKIIT